MQWAPTTTSAPACSRDTCHVTSLAIQPSSYRTCRGQPASARRITWSPLQRVMALYLARCRAICRARLLSDARLSRLTRGDFSGLEVPAATQWSATSEPQAELGPPKT